MNPITDWSTGNGGVEPEYAKSYPSDRITHRWPEPVGEKPRRYDDSTPPSYSESGANYPFRAGKTAAPNVTAPRGAAAPLDNSRGMPYRDRFNRGFGYIGSGSGGSKGRRGRSG
jgi:hypothetical protein